MDYLIHLKVEEERRNDMIRQIRNRQMRNNVLSNNAPDPLYAAMLLNLGRTLTRWGLRLQNKYGAIIEMPANYVSAEPGVQTSKPVSGC